MSLRMWRPDQVLVLAIVVVFGLGAGFGGGYALHRTSDVITPATDELTPTSHTESYDELWGEDEPLWERQPFMQEGEGPPEPSAVAYPPLETTPGFCTKIPMDSYNTALPAGTDIC